MKIHVHPTKPLRKQRGVSLVELMVSMAIGLIISAGAAALFANTILSTRTLNSASQIQEAGSQLSQTLTRQLRMMGYADWIDNMATVISLNTGANNSASYNLKAGSSQTVFQARFNQAPLHGCAAPYSTPSNLTVTTCGTASETSHSLTIAYQVRSDLDGGGAMNRVLGAVSMNTDFSNSRGFNGDCNNQATPSFFAVNRYYLGADNQLFCQGNAANSVPQPMASNIEQMVITYALAATNANTNASASSDEMVGAYQTADAISAITSENAWARVVSARICILVMGEAGSLAKAGTTTTSNRRDCNATTPTFISMADGRLRQTFTNTVALRNQVHTANLPLN